MKSWTASLLLASGFCSMVAASERWLPACGLGQLRSMACGERRSHVYDFTDPAAPWRPIGHAAELQGAALLLAGVAVVTLVPLLLGVRRSLTVWLAGAAFGAAFAVAGAQTLLSGRHGTVVTVPGGTAATLAVTLVWPLALVGVLVTAPAFGRPSAGWRGSAAVLLAAASPAGAHLVASAILSGVSSGAVPWTEAVGGIAAMLAGLALLPVQAPSWGSSRWVATQPWPRSEVVA